MDPITQNVTEVELKHGERIFLAPTGAKNIVSIEGSFQGGWSTLAPAKSDTVLIAAEVFDAGTKKRSKDLIRESLASKGASISFRDGADRTAFSASCFPEDLQFVLSLIAECAGEALMPAGEVALAKKRALGELEESLTDTRAQAAGALSRLLFAPGHVNHADSTQFRMKNLEGITRADVAAFQKSIGKSGLVLAITGDIETTKARKAAEKAFGSLAEGRISIAEERPNHAGHAVAETIIQVNDKANIDTYFGTSVPFTYDSPEYRPFVTLSSMLGGKGLSTGHLMRTIRERDGYTYGIYAQQTGFLKNTHGAFRIWATFSPHNFAEAVTATKKEIALFLKSGITESALALKKDEMVGNYLIGLSTSRGLASALHSIGVEGKPLTYIDEFPSLIRAVSLAAVKELSPLIAPEKLSMAASGSFPKV